MYDFDWREMMSDLWLTNATDGFIVIQNDADREWCSLISSILDRWDTLPKSRPDNLLLDIIQCDSGYAGSWQLAHRLANFPCNTRVRRSAHSAGLFLFMAGEERLARRDARFVFHGNVYRIMASGASNEERAEWFSSRTNMPYAWWLERAEADGVLAFGFDEAMEWGVSTGEFM